MPAVEFVAAVVALLVGITIQSSGVLVISLGVRSRGGHARIADAMPARTMTGAIIRAMLAAYRRTLEKTMAQARSMTQVVEEAQLPWLDTPDQAASGRSLSGSSGTSSGSSIGASRTWPAVGSVPRGAWLPGWGGATGTAAGGAGSGGGSLFSGSATPEFNGMFAAIGSVGAPPSKVGLVGFGGGGGFGGGASGGF